MTPSAPTRIGLLLLGLCTSALAEDATLVLDPSVVTGSRSASPTFDLPYSVDGISREQISDGQLGINASEALSRVPGLVVQNRQNYAQDLQISSRGFGARSAFGVRGLKLIADGIPASTPDGQGQAATFNLDTAERIEVLRGPAATLYGSNAGGVIQMFSRDGEGPPRIGAETLVGSDGLNKNHLTAEGAANGAGFVLDASRMDTNGYRDHSSARRDQTFAKLNVQPDDDSKLALIYSSLEQNGTQDPLGQTWEGYKADPRSVSINALTYNTRKSIDHQQLGVNYEHYFGDATLQVNGYTGRRSVIQYLSIPGTIPAGKRGGVVAFDRQFYGGSAHWLQPISSAPGDLTLIAGLDYDRSQDDRQGYSNTVNSVQGVKGALGRDEIDTATSLDPFVQANWLLGDWTLQAGLRHSTMEMQVDDHFLSDGDDSGKKTYQKNTPSVSVMYAFTPDLHGYVSAGKGFETPTQAESAYSSTSNGFNFALKPSVSKQYEVGVKARVGQDTRVNAALFQITTEDELVVQQSSGGRTTYQNAGRTLRRGFELGIESQLAEHWSTNLAYTRLQATYDSDFVSGGSTAVDKGNYLPGVPQTTLFAELNWKPRDWVSTALEGMYRSKVYVEDTNQQHAAPGYSVFNWRARFEQKVEHWTFHQTLRLDNLLDRQYIGSVIVGDGNRRYYEAAPGRSWYAGAGAEYQF
ncbi:TonB-dependent receptor [Pseudomonas syringae]|uniref:TonB-dependent receptor n=1 Tax=Pseudomonas syringae TaxID=317 RepID=A0A9Q3X2S5_PSESX|nr:TonB-dependent receptor [Pseudomonas syringae]MCF5061923.1 TonB-dependent receptor [Pseudomonas syringae]MCF5075303.1 TonB-dependent receptor [Pseudomonas syringae]MCF5120072.1 TonB-dependent receptor [Pseudomonas syringae]MCF5377165.1 TonB-dependent receptor [Pseudomonas syringae]